MAKKTSKKAQIEEVKNSLVNTQKLINNYDLKPVKVQFNTDEGDVEVEIKQCLSAQEMSDFINDGAESLFEVAEDTVSYLSFLYDFAFKFQVFRYFTNVEMPTDAWHLIMQTSFYDKMQGLLPIELLKQLRLSFDEAIEYRKTIIFSEEKKRLEQMKLQIQEYIDVISVFSAKLNGSGADEYMKNIDKLVELMNQKGEGAAAVLAAESLKVVK